MHIAIVNNAATKPDSLLRLLGKNTSQVFGYAESHLVEPAHFDLLILTGSSQFPIVYNREKLQAEIALIQRSNILTLGICYGCELIAVAFGSTLKDRGAFSQERAPFKIEVTSDNPIFLGHRDFMAYDAHRWTIDTLSSEIEVLARSTHGPEIIRHKNLPIYGFQFHPEKLPDETFGDELFAALVTQNVLT